MLWLYLLNYLPSPLIFITIYIYITVYVYNCIYFYICIYNQIYLYNCTKKCFPLVFMLWLWPHPFLIFCDTEGVPPSFLGLHLLHIMGSTVEGRQMCKIKLGTDSYFWLTLPWTKFLTIDRPNHISHSLCLLPQQYFLKILMHSSKQYHTKVIENFFSIVI